MLFISVIISEQVSNMQPNKKLKQAQLFDFQSQVQSTAVSATATPSSESAPATAVPPGTSPASLSLSNSTVLPASPSRPVNSELQPTTTTPDHQIRRHPNQPTDIVFPADTG